MSAQTPHSAVENTARSVQNRYERQGVSDSEGEGIDCVVIRLDSGSEYLAAALDTLSPDECERADRFVFKRDRSRYIAARGVLRCLLGERLHMPPEAIEFEYGRHGKPKLARGFSKDNLCFNMSHSEDVAIFGFAWGRRVGVDIEAVRDLPDADAVAARCFSSREYEAYLALDPRDRQAGFFNCWTRKEAFVKAIGDGLSYRLSDFDVSLAPGEPARILRIGELEGDSCGWQLADVMSLPGFATAIVIESSIN